MRSIGAEFYSWCSEHVEYADKCSGACRQVGDILSVWTKSGISAQLMTAAHPTVLSRQERAKSKTVNLDQLFLADLCHSGSSRSFDEGYGKT